MIYCFDFDGTLSNCTHRLEYANDKNWDEFHFRALIDVPIKQVCDLYKMIHESTNYKTCICTAKPERYKDDLLFWLKRNKLPNPDYLIMRPNHDLKTQASTLKIKMLIEHDEINVCNIAMFLDDKIEVVRAMLQKGIPATRINLM